MWPVSGDDKRYTKEFAAIAIDCLKEPDERAKLSDVCQRLEVMKTCYIILHTICDFTVFFLEPGLTPSVCVS